MPCARFPALVCYQPNLTIGSEPDESMVAGGCRASTYQASLISPAELLLWSQCKSMFFRQLFTVCPPKCYSTMALAGCKDMYALRSSNKSVVRSIAHAGRLDRHRKFRHTLYRSISVIGELPGLRLANRDGRRVSLLGLPPQLGVPRRGQETEEIEPEVAEKSLTAIQPAPPPPADSPTAA